LKILGREKLDKILIDNSFGIFWAFENLIFKNFRAAGRKFESLAPTLTWEGRDEKNATSSRLG
jgi:hypothetical protein